MPGPRDDRTEIQPNPAAPAAASADAAPTSNADSTELHPGAAPTVPPPPPPPPDPTAVEPQPNHEPTENAPAHEPADATAPSAHPPTADDSTEQQRTPKPRPAPGSRQVPGYRLVQALGAGTYGEVWLAEEERTGIRVAVKFLARGTGLEWQLVQAEVKQLALLHADPGIVQLLDVDLDARPPYYVMAYAERGSLAQWLDKGPLPLDEALGIFRQLAVALAYVHAKGVRHCDIKPGNVLLNARGRPLLADFGQAHLSTDAAPALGTFFYMAPEQADLSKQIPDTRWDVYGLGAIFFAMVTGGPPRDDPGARARLAQTPVLGERLRCYREWVARAPKPDGHRKAAGMDRRLADIVDRCLEVDPQKRPHDAGAILSALARRDRLRRQRPLLVTAFALQIVLFLLMGGAAVLAARSGLSRAEAALTAQLLDSDQASAALVAAGLEQEILAKQKILNRIADLPDLRRAAAAGDRAGIAVVMDRYSVLAGRDAFKWLVADADGSLLAFYRGEEPAVELTKRHAFADRDWFHGRGDGPVPAGKPPPPVSAGHVSQPFFGRHMRELVVGISEPVFDQKDKGRVVAVLFTAVPLRELHGWLDKAHIKGGFTVLLDRRGHLLRHPAEELIRAAPGRNPPRWSSETYREALNKEGRTDRHIDPVDGKRYLASYAPLPQVGWAAVVQHERVAALRPVEELHQHLIYVGVALAIGIPLLLAAVWATLIWVLRRKERFAQL